MSSLEKVFAAAVTGMVILILWTWHLLNQPPPGGLSFGQSLGHGLDQLWLVIILSFESIALGVLALVLLLLKPSGLLIDTADLRWRVAVPFGAAGLLLVAFNAWMAYG